MGGNPLDPNVPEHLLWGSTERDPLISGSANMGSSEN